MICRANQLTGFQMGATLAFNGSKKLTLLTHEVIIWVNFGTGVFVIDKFLFPWQILMKLDKRYHTVLSKLTTYIDDLIIWVIFSMVP